MHQPAASSWSELAGVRIQRPGLPERPLDGGLVPQTNFGNKGTDLSLVLKEKAELLQVAHPYFKQLFDHFVIETKIQGQDIQCGTDILLGPGHQGNGRHESKHTILHLGTSLGNSRAARVILQARNADYSQVNPRPVSTTTGHRKHRGRTTHPALPLLFPFVLHHCCITAKLAANACIQVHSCFALMRRRRASQA